MANPQARKGAGFERDVVEFLRAHGHPYAERHYGAGRPHDVGDIDGVPGFTIEVKNHRAMDLAGWMTEAERERVAGRQRWAALVVKRRNRPTQDAYVVVSLQTFAALLADDLETVP